MLIMRKLKGSWDVKSTSYKLIDHVDYEIVEGHLGCGKQVVKINQLRGS